MTNSEESLFDTIVQKEQEILSLKKERDDAVFDLKEYRDLWEQEQKEHDALKKHIAWIRNQL